MENTKAVNNEETKTTVNGENPFSDDNNSSITNTVASVVEENEQEGESNNMAVVDNPSNNNQRMRTPFTNLSQVDADLVLARTLQEQERAYMMLRMNGDGSGYGSWEAGSYVHEDDDDFDHPSEEEYDGTDMDDVVHEDIDDDEDDDDDDDEDAFDVHAHTEDEVDSIPRTVLGPFNFSNDEAYARALQDAEESEMAARLLALAGINEREAEDTDTEDHGVNSQDAWEDVDPDELSYEELLALGEVVGTESRGLSADTIASLPSINYKSQSTQEGTSDSCVICRLDYEDGDTLTSLSCKHLYHAECINNWLCINKVCPICNAEVSTSGSSS